MILIESTVLGRVVTGLAFQLLTVLPIVAADVVLTGDTSEPAHSTFVPGQEFVLKFRISGLAPDTEEQLAVRIVDEMERPVLEVELPLVVGSNAGGRIRYEDEKWKVDILAPTNRLGFFQAFARLSSGEELPAIASRPAGYLTYAIVPSPSERVHYPARETFFGMMGAFQPALLGSSWNVRSYQVYNWGWFEPDRPGQFDETVEKNVAAMKTGGNGFPPGFEESYWFNAGGKAGSIPAYFYLFIGAPPSWAADNRTRTHLTATLTPDGEKAYREFCLKLGHLMAASFSNQPTHYYQVTAEPEYPWGFKGSPDDLMKIYEIAYTALHEADPMAVVGGPAIGILGSDQIRDLLQRGFGRYIDVLDFHPYMGGDVQPIDIDLVGRIREFKAMLAEYCDKPLLLAGTESGYNAAGDNKEMWLKKAWSDVHHNLILLGEGFWFNTSFHGADMTRKPGENTWGYYFNLDPERDFGIQKGSPKPVVPAYAAMSFLLEGHTTAGSIDWLGEDTCGYAYERSNDVVLAIWSYQPHEVTLPAGVSRVRVYDWMGNAKSVACPEGLLTLPLTREPTYVRDVAPAVWKKHGKGRPLAVTAVKTRCLPGDTLTVPCKVVHLRKKPLTGELRFIAPQGLGVSNQTRSVSLRKGGRVELNFPVTIPPSAAPGMYPLAFRLHDGETPLAGDGFLLKVEPAISIDRVIPATGGKGAGLAVTLSAPERRGTKGKLSVEMGTTGTAIKELPFVLKPGEARTQRIMLDEAPGQTVKASYRVKASTSAGAVASKEIAFEMLTVDFMKKAPVIDGSFSDWEGGTAMGLGEANLVQGAERWKGKEDLSAWVRLGWDEGGLYLACEVMDDTHWQRVGDLALDLDDGLKLGINIDPENAAAKGSQNVESGVMRRWHDFTFGMRQDKNPWIRAGRSASYDTRFAPTGELGQAELSHAIVRDGGVTRYEAAIPWALLNREKEPVAGDAVGVALVVGDRDIDPGNEGDTWQNYSVMGLFNGLHLARDFTGYGWAVLSAGAVSTQRR